jgi:hypothetical protein
VFSGAKAENAGVQTGHGREGVSLRDLAAVLKLPAGTLSESLISFFRYFSLPLEPKNLAVLRREVLGQKHREAAALAAASAAAKGLALESRALTGYAAAIEGIEGGGRDNGGGAHDQTAGGGGNPHDGAAGNGTNGRRRDETGGTKPDVGKITPGEIRQGITEILEREPLLDFINRIPGKRGRWVVLPFSCSDNGIELAVSFRILIDMVSKFAADIKVSGPGAARRWFFLLDGITGDGNFSGCRAELSAAPPLTGKSESDLAAACAGLFGMAQDRVTVKDGVPPCADARPDPLSSVDEEI